MRNVTPEQVAMAEQHRGDAAALEVHCKAVQLPEAVPLPILDGDEAADAPLHFVDVNLPARLGCGSHGEGMQAVQLAREVASFPVVLREDAANASSVTLRVVRHRLDRCPPSAVGRAWL